MLALVASTGATAVISSHVTVERFSATAQELEATGAYTARLEAAIIENERLTHALLSGGPVRPEQVLGLHRAVEDEFAAGFALFHEPRLRDALNDVHRRWRTALSDVEVLGPQVLEFESRGVDGSAHDGTLEEGTDEAIAELTVIDEIVRGELRNELDEAHQFRVVSFAAVIGVVVLAWLAMLYFAGRIARDVLHPVESLQEGIRRVRSGDLDHRVELSSRHRGNELTELATGFNEMAGELADIHRELTFRALHDSLTGLPNRLALLEHLSTLFANAGALREQPDVSVLFVDLDDFKVANDTLGHAAGDELLRQVAERLAGCTRATDIVGRLGGDEFAIVVTGDAARSAVGVAERALTALSVPFVVQGHVLSVSASIGVGLTRPETTDPEELLGNADFAMYMAKSQGKRRFELYDPDLHAATTGNAVLRSDLRRAVDNGELVLDYQPIMELASGTIVGLEALLRWEHPVRGLLGPDGFISIAEQTGEIDDIGLWVLRTATEQLAQWRHAGTASADLWVSVNLSPAQLGSEPAVARLAEVLSTGPVPAAAVVLELTESAHVLSSEQAAHALQVLRDTGARIALDDFGTGLSSLSTLAGLPVDILKIDRAFVSGEEGRLPSTPVLQTVIALAEHLGLGVIAEGVEDAAQMTTLQGLGCQLGQGFGLGRPTSPVRITTLLSRLSRALDVPAPGQVAAELGTL